MHPLINAEMVEVIRRTGNARENLPDRAEILERYKLPCDQPADHVVVTGCVIFPVLPHVIASLSRVLDRGGLSHTFLSKEYCCGNYLYRPVIKARDEDAMKEVRALSKTFIQRNLDQARTLGARRLVIFCSPCYPIYKHAFPEEEIVFYPTALGEVMERMPYDAEIDYYAGCYRLHRKFSPVPMDLKSTEGVFDKLEGLRLHRISAPKCCYSPEGLSHMLQNIRSPRMVHVCTGCYTQAKSNLPSDHDTEVLMLPEWVERVMSK